MENQKGNKKLFIIAHIAICAAFVFISLLYSGDITYSDVEPIVSILQNSSAMVFTIMGIWIAYLYPNAVLRIIDSDVDSIFPSGDEKRVKLLVGIVALSAFIMAALLIGTAIKPFLIKSHLYKEFSSFFNGAGLFALFCLIYAQIFCIYIVFISNINFLTDLKNKRHQKALVRKLDRNNKK